MFSKANYLYYTETCDSENCHICKQIVSLIDAKLHSRNANILTVSKTKKMFSLLVKMNCLYVNKKHVKSVVSLKLISQNKVAIGLFCNKTPNIEIYTSE